MRSLLVCLAMAGTVWGSVKLMARERARKGEERREGGGGKLVEALAGREVFHCFEGNYFLW